MTARPRYRAIVLGCSAGGIDLVGDLAMSLPRDFGLALIVVLHLGEASSRYWADILGRDCRIPVKEADEKEHVRPGVLYLAPADYHLLVEADLSFTLTVDERVNYARPSIDVLFETAADAYRERLIGIVGTGANRDGAQGLLRVRERGGLTIVQEPASAAVRAMPDAAVQTADPHYLLDPAAMAAFLLHLHGQHYTDHETQH